jgi:type II secretory pathway pseudopilin PulG
VAIIGVLSSVVISSLNTARAKGRDARRIRDIQEINKAIQLYIADRGHAPNFGDNVCSTVGSGSGSRCSVSDVEVSYNYTYHWVDLANELSPYIKKLPKDPCGAACYKNINGVDYFFNYQYFAPGAFSSHGPTDYVLQAESFEAKTILPAFRIGDSY